MQDPVLIAPPAAEPVTLAEVKLQLGFSPFQDSDRAASQMLNDKLRSYALAARRECESYSRLVFITQHWLLRLDGFTGADWRYNWKGYPVIRLTPPPLQSVDSVNYIDTFGAIQ